MNDFRTAVSGSGRRWWVLLLFLALLVQCTSPPGDASPTVSPAPRPMMGPTRSGGDLYEGIPVLAVDRPWTVEELLARSEQEQSAAWADGEELTFFYQGEAEEMHICCGLQMPMQRVGDTDSWALTVRVRGLSQAVISYSFVPYEDGLPVDAAGSMAEAQVWRGPKAPAAPQRAESLQGRVKRYVVDSAALDASRDLTVYLPPGHDSTRQYPVVYAADGETVRGFATVLEPQIVDGSLPAVIVVGVHAGGYGGSTASFDPSQDLRAQEYLLGMNPERFQAHEQFFVYEVSDWAERTLGASPRREERAIFGYSNGGAFAVSMGIRHPERYGAVLAFSLGRGQEGWGTPDWTADTAPRHYLVTGTLEPFQQTTADWAGSLAWTGVEHIYRERVCGHDIVMWEEEFPGAVAWAFRDMQP